MFEVITDWVCNAHTGLVSVQYFDESVGVASSRASLNTFLTGLVGSLNAGTTFTIRTSGKQLDPLTGNLTGVWSDTTPRTGVGSASGASWADVNQALIRWRTPSIVNSRFVQGRTFIPGLAQNVIIGGNLTSALVTDWSTKAQTYADASNGAIIWSRPFTPPAGGSGVARPGTSCPIISGTVWSEVAVLRRRRL